METSRSSDLSTPCQPCQSTTADEGHAQPNCASAKKAVSQISDAQTFSVKWFTLPVAAVSCACFGIRWAVGSCHQRLGLWLLAELTLSACFLAAFYIGSQASTSWLTWFFRPPTRTSALAFQVSWALLLPLAFACLERGARWLSEAMADPSNCISDLVCVIYAVLLIVFGILTTGYSIFVGNVLWYDRSMQTSAVLLNAVEDADMVARWGRQGPKLASEFHGLSADALALLHTATYDHPSSVACSICLDQIAPGDKFRQLPCEHAFHRPCVDLWLLRQATCPMCKHEVKLSSKA